MSKPTRQEYQAFMDDLVELFRKHNMELYGNMSDSVDACRLFFGGEEDKHKPFRLQGYMSDCGSLLSNVEIVSAGDGTPPEPKTIVSFGKTYHEIFSKIV